MLLESLAVLVQSARDGDLLGVLGFGGELGNQQHSPLLLFVEVFTSAAFCKNWFMSFVDYTSHVSAVSYTHLDVYKRQLLYIVLLI